MHDVRSKSPPWGYAVTVKFPCATHPPPPGHDIDRCITATLLKRLHLYQGQFILARTKAKSLSHFLLLRRATSWMAFGHLTQGW